MMRSRLLAIGMLLALPSCYRTTYFNLQPPAEGATPLATSSSPASGWQHFFLWGWAPDKRVYTAESLCGTEARVEEIRTQQTFTQGLVEILASYYVNIYSPYDAQIVCAPFAEATPDAASPD
jgi:hypothetical protein